MNSDAIHTKKDLVKKNYKFDRSRDSFHGSRTYKSFSFSYHTKRKHNRYHYRRKVPERPPSPLPGTEEYTNRLISEKSDFIKQQLNLDAPVQNYSVTPAVNNQIGNNSLLNHEERCSVNIDESEKVIKSPKKKKKSTKLSPVKEYSEGEIYDKVFNFLACLSQNKKKKLINSDASDYDIICQQTGIKERVILNRILRDFIDKHSENVDSQVNPEINVEAGDLPEGLVNALGLDSATFDDASNSNRSEPFKVSVKEEPIESDLDSYGISQNESNFSTDTDDTSKTTQSSIALMLKSLQEILEIDDISTKNSENNHQPKIDEETKSDANTDSQNQQFIETEEERKKNLINDFTEDVTLNDAFFKTYGVSLDTSEHDNNVHEEEKKSVNTSILTDEELNKNIETVNSNLAKKSTTTDKVVENFECPKEHSDFSFPQKESTETTDNTENHQPAGDNLMKVSDEIICSGMKDIDDKGKCSRTENSKNDDSGDQNINSNYTEEELINDINKKTLVVVVPKLITADNNNMTLNKNVGKHSGVQNDSTIKETSENSAKTPIPTPKLRIISGLKKTLPASRQVQFKKTIVKKRLKKSTLITKDEATQTTEPVNVNSKEFFDQIKKQQSKFKIMIRQIVQIDKKIEQLNKKRQDLFVKVSAFNMLEDVKIPESTKRKRKKSQTKSPNENKIKKRRGLISKEAKLIEEALNESKTSENIPLKTTDLNTTGGIGSSLWIIDTEVSQDSILKEIETTNQIETHDKMRMLDENFDVEFKDFSGNIVVIEVFGNNILAGSTSGFVYLFEIPTGQLRESLKISELSITSIVVTEIDKNITFYVGTHDSTLNIYSFCDKKLRTVTISEGIQCMDFSWDYIFIGSCNGSVMRLNTKSEKIEFHSKISDKSVLVIKATLEGPRRVLLLGLRDSKIYIRDAMSGLPMRSLCEDKEKTIYSLCLSNSSVYCGTNESDVFVYRFSDGEFLTKFQTSSSRSVSFIEVCGDLLFAGCYNSKIYVFDIKNNAFLNCLDGPNGILLAMKVWNNVIIASTKSHFKAWKVPNYFSR